MQRNNQEDKEQNLRQENGRLKNLEGINDVGGIWFRKRSQLIFADNSKCCQYLKLFKWTTTPIF